MSLVPKMLPEQRMHTVTIEEILSLGESIQNNQPSLEHYFSPTRKEMFIKDYLHYLNTSLLDAKHGNLDLDLYLVLVLSFQFTSPLLEIPVEKELGLFYHIHENHYNVDDLDINLHFTTDEPEKGMVAEEDALLSFRNELENSYDGRRGVKESVQKRLKQDGIRAIMNWQQAKGIPELAEAFGRSIVIPSFFSFIDKKLVEFYRETSRGIRYEVAVPDFE
ncbi:MAG TPA: hypothetical protein ENI20_13380 [Bacteroides sp.]|nr:hypothetical protein [Bacteroides sp.]